jgi:hypothetical protein
LKRESFVLPMLTSVDLQGLRFGKTHDLFGDYKQGIHCRILESLYQILILGATSVCDSDPVSSLGCDLCALLLAVVLLAETNQLAEVDHKHFAQGR